MSKNRNSKKFRKSLKIKSINKSFVKNIKLGIPEIELDTKDLKPYHSEKVEIFDLMSDKMEVLVKRNWERYGVPFLNQNDRNIDLHESLDNDIKYNSDTFQKYGSKGKFYHLTSSKNYQKIMKEGIKSKDVNRMTSMGTSEKIWVIESDSPLIWNQIGYSQLGFGVKDIKMVVLEIDSKGINGEVTSEEINEFTSPLHSVINQSHIDSKFIKPIGYFKSSRKHFYLLRDELGKLKSTLYKNQFKMVG